MSWAGVFASLISTDDPGLSGLDILERYGSDAHQRWIAAGTPFVPSTPAASGARHRPQN